MKVKNVESPKQSIVATDAELRIDLGDDASGVPTQEILIHEDVMKDDDHAKLLHSSVTQTSTEETNEAHGSSDYSNYSSEYGVTELIVDSVMFSLELNSFLRADEVQEKKYNHFMSNDEAYFNLAIENGNSHNIIVTTKEVDKKFRAIIKQYEINNPWGQGSFQAMGIVKNGRKSLLVTSVDKPSLILGRELMFAGDVFL